VGRKGRILLIDDEGYVRTVGKMSLEPLGHTVLLAEDGRSGIEVFRLHQDDLDLVLLDMNMPDWSGAEVLREIRKLSKSVPVAIVSGYTEQGTRTQFDGMELAGFIQKPFSRSAFVEQVARLLEVAK
jgi:CheY-like chemotaxis protein